MEIELFPHNQTAYDAAMDMMEKNGKAAVIHPTGTGKSMIAFQLALKHPNDTVFWLAPSEYIYQTQVRGLLDAMPDFKPQVLSNISFMTYAKLRMHEDELDCIKADWIICDEFHRAGSPQWGRCVRKLLNSHPKAKVLGLSATNIRYLDNHRDMAEELFNGHIASEMSLGEAIAKHILPAPTYVISMYAYGQKLKEITRRIQALGNPKIQSENEKLLKKLKRALEQSKGLDQVFQKHMPDFHGKYLVFCAGKEHMEEMIKKCREWFHLIDNEPHIYCVTYEDPKASQNYESFLKDDSVHLKLLFSIDMLNEGIHVKGVDGVILFRPTISPILYQQQIGRALEAGKKKTPVIFDIVNNFESLCSIDSIRKEAEAALAFTSNQDYEKIRFEESFQIIDEVRDCRSIFSEIKKNLLAGWESYFQEARKYFMEHGNLKVPRNYVTSEGLALGSWLVTQKRVYAGKISGNLTEEQICRLNEIGMDWNSGYSQSFERGYKALAAYYQKYGNADVKASYVAEDGYPLGRWVGNIRRKNKGECGRALSKEQKSQLDELHMIWDKTEYQWNKNFESAKAYYETYGNLKVPRQYVAEDGFALGVWLDNQRAIYEGRKQNASPLTKNQISRLESIGMEWEKGNHRQWQERYCIAERYYKTHGNLKVPVTYVTEDGLLLGRWVGRQREKYKKHALSREQRELLLKIGFEGDMNQYGR